jgi:hypothetical protein
VQDASSAAVSDQFQGTFEFAAWMICFVLLCYALTR